jgi:hypothetical protein
LRILTSTSSTAELSCNPLSLSYIQLLIFDLSDIWEMKYLPLCTACSLLSLPPFIQTHDGLYWQSHLFKNQLDVPSYEDQVFRYGLHTFKSIRQKFMSFPYFFLFIQQQSWQCYILCTHSLSILQSLQGHSRPSGHSAANVLQPLQGMKSVVLCWGPSHTGLPKNEDVKEANLLRNSTSGRALGNDVHAHLRYTVLSLM